MLLLEDQDAHGRELLGHRGQAKYRVGRIRDVVFAVGQSVTIGEYHIPIRCNQDSSAKLFFVCQLREISLRFEAEIRRTRGDCEDLQENKNQTEGALRSFHVDKHCEKVSYPQT